MPSAVRRVLDVTDLLNVTIGSFVPLECLRLGTFYQLLLTTMLSPLVVALAIVVGFLLFIAAPNVDLPVGAAVRKAMLCALRWLLILFYLVFPIVTFLIGHLSKFNEEVQELGKRLVQAALQLHKRVAATFRKTAQNFHYEFNVRHVAGVFQGLLMGKPAQLQDPLKMTQLWLHESERTYGDRLVSVGDLKKYKDIAVEQAKKIFKEMSPPVLFAEPLIFCHFAQGVGDKIYDVVKTFPQLSELLNGALEEYNETNAAMNLVLFEDAMRHVCRVSRIIESSGGHALMVGVGGSGKQSLARLATYINSYSAFQVVITSRYSVNDRKADLRIMYR